MAKTHQQTGRSDRLSSSVRCSRYNFGDAWPQTPKRSITQTISRAVSPNLL